MKDDNTLNDSLPAEEEETALHPCQTAGGEEEHGSDEIDFSDFEDDENEDEEEWWNEDEEDDDEDEEENEDDDEDDDEETEFGDGSSLDLRLLAGQDNAAAVEKLYKAGGLDLVKALADKPEEGLFYDYDIYGLHVEYFMNCPAGLGWERLYSYTDEMSELLCDAEEKLFRKALAEAREKGAENPILYARERVCEAAELGTWPAYAEADREGAHTFMPDTVDEMEVGYRRFCQAYQADLNGDFVVELSGARQSLSIPRAKLERAAAAGAVYCFRGEHREFSYPAAELLRALQEHNACVLAWTDAWHFYINMNKGLLMNGDKERTPILTLTRICKQKGNNK